MKSTNILKSPLNSFTFSLTPSEEELQRQNQSTEPWVFSYKGPTVQKLRPAENYFATNYIENYPVFIVILQVNKIKR